jgi:glycosyltransferase involved in cell wall biosynthesis
VSERIPPLSVVMPARNAAPYLDAAIVSILTQTFTDFELVVIDDASTDGSSEILAAWAARDPRVRVERSDVPLGLVGSSNRAVRASRAPIVARMDADDVSHPERLRRQLDVLATHGDAVLVGTLFEGIDGAGRLVRPRDRWRLLGPSPFAPFPHGSAMFRREDFEAIGGYRAETEYWEDLDLFHRLAARGRVLVLPEALYRYRFHVGATRLAGDPATVEPAVARMIRAAGYGVDEPRAAYSLAASRLWAGHPPHLWSTLRLPSLVPPRLSTLAIFGVAAAGALSPRATRFALGCIIGARDRLASVRIGPEPREWRFAS